MLELKAWIGGELVEDGEFYVTRVVTKQHGQGFLKDCQLSLGER